MYKVKRFSWFGFGNKFTPDMDDMYDLHNYTGWKFMDKLEVIYPKLKSFTSYAKLSSKLYDMNILWDDYGVWKDCELFTVYGVEDGSPDVVEFIYNTESIRKSLKSNDYIAIGYDGSDTLVYQISTKKLLNIDTYSRNKVTKEFRSITDYVRYELDVLKNIIENALENWGEEYSDEDIKLFWNHYDKYAKLVNSIR